MTASAIPHRPFAPGLAAGVTEPMIRQVVHAFYAEVRRDPVLGPVFNRVIGDGWDEHLARLCDFWSSVLLATGRFSGAPMVAHARVADIEPAHFERWLALFRDTVEAICPPAAAALFVERSQVIGRSLRLGLAASRGDLPPMRPTAT